MRRPKKFRKFARMKRRVSHLSEIIERTVIVKNLEAGTKHSGQDLQLTVPASTWLQILRWVPAMAVNPDYSVTLTYKGFQLRPDPLRKW